MVCLAVMKWKTLWAGWLLKRRANQSTEAEEAMEIMSREQQRFSFMHLQHWQ